MTNRLDYTDADLDRLFARVYDFGKLLDTQVTELANLRKQWAYSVLDQESTNEVNARDLDHALGIARNVVSNLYDDPFPPATEAEWDEAHETNTILTLMEFVERVSGPYPNISAADTFMGIFGFTRDEADCECTCCQQRKAVG